MWIAALVTAVLALLIIINLSSGEKKIEHELIHLYGVDDPQFARTVGTLLGPALVPGNQVTPLYNGDQIFPSMLEAIRGARRRQRERAAATRRSRRHPRASISSRSDRRRRSGRKDRRPRRRRQ